MGSVQQSSAAPQGARMAAEHKPGRPVLLADIGSTQARFAVLADGRQTPIETMHDADFPELDAALRAFMAGDVPDLRGERAILGVAGPIEGERCTLTNRGWHIDAEELRRDFGFARVDLVNDFAALGWSLPLLGPGDLYRIGGGVAQPGAPMAVLGPGTGLGLACRVGEADCAMVLESEGGHATLTGADAREDAVIRCLRDRFGHASAERALSGPGLVNLYHAVAEVDGCIAPPRDAAEITAAALDGSCAQCDAALKLFCAMLGGFAGNAALTFGARGGVFIGGGVVPHLCDYLARSEFRQRFEAKGRLRRVLAGVPTSVITHKSPAFVGLRALAGQG